MSSYRVAYESDGVPSKRVAHTLSLWGTQENLLIAVVFFSVGSLFAIEVHTFPILKVLALSCLVLAAIVSARVTGAPFFVYASGASTAVVLLFIGLAREWGYLEGWGLWLIKPLLSISVMVMSVPLLGSFDYSSSKFQKGLAFVVILLMSTLFAQVAIFLATKEVFDFQAALGFEQTRSHHQIYSIEVFRFSGMAVEPAIYCSTMFCLLMLCGSRTHWVIRIPAEVSIGLCLSATGWIMLGVLFYRNFLIMPLRIWLKAVLICLFALIPSLLILYPADAAKFTMLRIVCPQTDPSANARLLAFLPQNAPSIDIGICPSTGIVPDAEDISREAMNGHRRGSNFTFIQSVFGMPGLFIFSAFILSLIVVSRRLHSAPIFLFALLMSSLTEPIFWLGFLGCALLLRRVGLPCRVPKEALK